MNSRSSPFSAASRSESGLRAVNEDAVLSMPLPDGRWLAAVADGMGGLHEGEAASRTALDALRRGVEGGHDLVEAVLDANRAVVRGSPAKAMGTTLVAALFEGGRVRIANVGDSRAYLLGRPGLVQVTRDHTFGAEAAGRDEAVAREVAASRWGGTLTRSLGSSETVEVDEFGPLLLEDGIRVLLCTDGVHGALDDREIQDCLRDEPSVDGTVRRLLALALERGSQDNLSAVVVQNDRLPTARSRTPVAAPPQEAGTVRHGGGVPEPGAPEPRAPEIEPAGPEGGGRGREEGRPAAASWDPARLARRAPRRRKRKPGTLGNVLVVLMLAGTALLILMLLP